MAVYEEEFKFPDESDGGKKKAAPVEDQLDIEIEDDTPVEDRGRKAMAEPPEDVTEDELQSYDEKVQKRIKKFTRGYHDERRAKEEALRERQAAEEFARQMYEENQTLQKQLHEGSKIFIEQGKSAAQIELESAEKAYRDAFEAGDTESLLQAQRRVTAATLKLDKAENLQPIAIKEKPEYSPPQRTNQDKKLAGWMADNPWYGNDDEPEHTVMSATALGMHNALVKQFGQGYVGSDEYYDKINARMRASFPDYFGSEEDSEPDEEPARRATTTSRTKPSTVVAPATRSTSPKKVKLSASQVAIAKRLGVPLELYAKKVAEQMENR